MAVGKNITQILKNRGIELNPPATNSEFTRVGEEYNTNIGLDFYSVYALFNGFVVHDGASMLMLWDINKIVSAKYVYRSNLKETALIPIGDYMIDSDILVAHVSDSVASVKLLFEDREIARSIMEFVELLALGQFDSH